VSRQTARPETATPARRRHARLITEVLAPAPLAVVLLTFVAWHSAKSASTAILSAVIAVLFGSVLPFLYIIRGVRRGRWANHHVPERELRSPPLLVGLASVVICLGLLTWLGAGRQLLALVGAMIAGLTVSLAITQFWKMSIHAAVGAGTVVILMLVYGPWAAVAWPLAGAIAWSRVVLGDHTLAQVVVGCGIGAAVAGLAFSLLS